MVHSVNLTPSKDTYINSQSSTNNYGDQPTIRTGRYLFGVYVTTRGLIQFAKPDWAPMIAVTSATLRLYSPMGDFTKTHYCQRLIRTDWVEAEATWNIYKTGSAWSAAGAGNSADDYTATDQATASAAVDNWLEFDVTAQVEWARSNDADPAFRIVCDEGTSTGEIQFASKEYPKDAPAEEYWPHLVIEYRVDPVAYERTISASMGMATGLVSASGLDTFLCVASRDGGTIRTNDGGATWTVCAKDSAGRAVIPGSFLAQFDNRLCVLNNQNSGFAYSEVNDIISDWDDKPNFPNLPVKFTDLFVGRNPSDEPTLYFLTQKSLYTLDVFSNFVFNPTDVTWEEDETSGKCGLYWKGDNLLAVGKGIYQVHQGEVSLIGPDQDDGLPEELQGSVADMIGVGFWLVIAVDGGATKKSCILKRYITGKHWHPVYVTSGYSSIKSICWDNGTLYFGEGSEVKSLPFPAVTDNVNKLSTQPRAAGGTLTYPYYHSEFEAMPKVAHKVWANTQDCNADEKIDIYYRIDEATGWTYLGSFTSAPRPAALTFGANGEGIEFERIQFQARFARGAIMTNSPKLESLILEFRVIPPTLWSWTFKVAAKTSGSRTGQSIIDALRAAVEKKTLMPFYPSGDKGGACYYVEVKDVPGNEDGTEFGNEGIYSLTVSQVID